MAGYKKIFFADWVNKLLLTELKQLYTDRDSRLAEALSFVDFIAIGKSIGFMRRTYPSRRNISRLRRTENSFLTPSGKQPLFGP